MFLTTPRADFLRGRWISANWDVNELETKKDDITDQGLLKLGLKATFGPRGPSILRENKQHLELEG